ncbi:helix-turn-helix domain-containing protein [Streptomyces sp. SID14446]|uniref:helix-turn-helix domain-containing protein n=1 Tax=Streptomyces sp. SID14446 TaxID=2706072 RepID=UPI0031BB120C
MRGPWVPAGLRRTRRRPSRRVVPGLRRAVRRGCSWAFTFERAARRAHERGQKPAEIAPALRISVRSVERWRRAWRERGEAGVLSKGHRACLGPVKSGSPGWSGS